MKKALVLLLAVTAVIGLRAVPTFSADKLIVQDSGGANTVLAVEDGTSTPNRILRVIGGVPIMQNAGTAGFDFKNTGASFGASISVGTLGNPNFYGNWQAVTNHQDDVTKPSWGLRLDIGHDNFHVLRAAAAGSGNPPAASLADVFVINANGSLTSSNGATLTAGGHWQDGSSREYKENITALSPEEAINTLAGLNPVKYSYKADKDEKHVGFIAEDVPDLVATKDRKTLSPMDIVAVLTKVVREQQKTNQEQQAVINTLTEKLAQLEAKMDNLQPTSNIANISDQK